MTQSRVPEGAGLGERGALAVAVAGATARALGRDLGAEELARIARIAAAPAVADGDIAVVGGTVAWHADGAAPRPEALAVDPGRIEESLLLFQCEPPLDPIGSAEVPAVVSVAGRVREALGRGRLEDVTGLWREEWEVRGVGAPDAAAGSPASCTRRAARCGPRAAGAAASSRPGPLRASAGPAAGRRSGRRRGGPDSASTRLASTCAASRWTDRGRGIIAGLVRWRRNDSGDAAQEGHVHQARQRALPDRRGAAQDAGQPARAGAGPDPQPEDRRRSASTASGRWT